MRSSNQATAAPNRATSPRSMATIGRSGPRMTKSGLPDCTRKEPPSATVTSIARSHRRGPVPGIHGETTTQTMPATIPLASPPQTSSPSEPWGGGHPPRPPAPPPPPPPAPPPHTPAPPAPRGDPPPPPPPGPGGGGGRGGRRGHCP